MTRRAKHGTLGAFLDGRQASGPEFPCLRRWPEKYPQSKTCQDDQCIGKGSMDNFLCFIGKITMSISHQMARAQCSAAAAQFTPVTTMKQVSTGALEDRCHVKYDLLDVTSHGVDTTLLPAASDGKPPS